MSNRTGVWRRVQGRDTSRVCLHTSTVDSGNTLQAHMIHKHAPGETAQIKPAEDLTLSHSNANKT